MPEAVKNELYEEQLSVIREKYQEKRNDYVKVLQKKPKGRKFRCCICRWGWSWRR